MPYTFPRYELRDTNDDGTGDGGGGGGGATFTQEQLDAAVAAAVQRETGGLASKRDELLGKLNGLKPIKELVGDMSPDDLKSALELARETKDAEARAAGDFDRLKTELVEKHGKDLTTRDDRIGVLEGALFKVLAKEQLGSILGSEEVQGNAKILMPHLLPHVSIAEPVPGEFVAQVIDPKTKDVRHKDGQGTPMSLADLVSEFRADKEFGTAFGAGTATGSDAHRSDDKGGAKTVVIPRDADTDTYRKLRADAEEAGVPWRVGE